MYETTADDNFEVNKDPYYFMVSKSNSDVVAPSWVDQRFNSGYLYYENKPGSFTLGVHYVRADAGSYLLGNSALDMTDQLEYGWDNGAGVKFWTAKAGVAVQKNVELDAYYNFGAKHMTARRKSREYMGR